MSAVIKAITPFLDKQLLLDSLQEKQVQYSESGHRILIPHLSAYRNAFFEKDSLGKYVFSYDSDVSTTKFLADLEPLYKKKYQQKMEELERRRIEAEKKREEEERLRIEAEKKRLVKDRKPFVEKQKQEIRKKAQEMGYDVKETTQGKKIQLVLVKRTH